MREEYMSGQKLILFREFIGAIEKFHLTDITIKQKTDFARLTAFMHQISLHSINLEHAEVDLSLDNEDDNAIFMKISKVQITLAFDHWLELQTSESEEEWGIGLFEIQDLDFELTIQPTLVEEKLKANIVSFDMKIRGDHQMYLYTQTDSKFSELLVQFAGVFSQNIRQHLN